LRNFFLVTFWLWQKDFGKKALSHKKRAHKMLMKLTTGGCNVNEAAGVICNISLASMGELFCFN
jgi:hypothetical protein